MSQHETVNAYTETNTELDIETTLGRMVDAASARETDDLFYEIVDNAMAHDLQMGRIVELQFKRDEMMGELMADPYHSFVRETSILQRLYENRSMRRVTDEGAVTQFATRNTVRDDVDLVFRVIDSGDQQAWVTLETQLQGQLETPCRIVAKDGRVSVFQQAYHRGAWQDVELSIREGERGDALLKAVFADMIWATSLNYERTPDEREASDVHAVNLLAGYIAHRRSV